MTDNNRVHRNAQSPHQFIEGNRNGEAQKIPEQKLVVNKQASEAKTDRVRLPPGINQGNGEFQHPGSNRADCRALNSKLWKPKQAEDQNAVDEHITDKGAKVNDG